jgi:hypothetical protein
MPRLAVIAQKRRLFREDLVVEDEAASQKILRYFLSREDYEIAGAKRRYRGIRSCAFGSLNASDGRFTCGAADPLRVAFEGPSSSSTEW